MNFNKNLIFQQNPFSFPLQLTCLIIMCKFCNFSTLVTVAPIVRMNQNTESFKTIIEFIIAQLTSLWDYGFHG